MLTWTKIAALYSHCRMRLSIHLRAAQCQFCLSDANREAIFCIRDQGIGIPSEDQQQMFEPFHQGKNVSSITGLG